MKWGVRRYQNKDGTLTSEGKKHYSQDHEDYTRAHTKKSVREMSDSELNARINRLQKEQQYERLTASPSKLQKAIKIAGTTATALGTVMTLYNNGSNAMKLGKSIVESREFKNAVVGGALAATMKAHGA
jgi:ribosomal protein L29